MLVVSPSGNFYGSEQVLYDYLKYTNCKFDVAVPARSRFYEILRELNYQIIEFHSVTILYLKVFFWLLFQRYGAVYINEAGHSRYILLLARLFPKLRFVVHVRINEDAIGERLKGTGYPNLILVSISDYISSQLKERSTIVYDLFDFPDNFPTRHFFDQGKVRIALIGRLSISKGFRELVLLARALESRAMFQSFVLNIYGDVMNEVKDDEGYEYLRNTTGIVFHGFVPKKEIYDNSDIILHLSKTEPLGRIYFEAISAGLPLVGFNSGGIGEIASKCGLEVFLVDPGPDESQMLIDKLEWVWANKDTWLPNVEKGLLRMKQTYSRKTYVSAMDTLLLGLRIDK